MYEVKDGARTLRFSGELLGQSSSRRADSGRWIEFHLYRTDKGSYILSRVGVSNIYHSSVCSLVSRYGLHEKSIDDLNVEAVPCSECCPNIIEPLIFPEEYRYWTLISEEPEAILNALYKPDDSGARYLTNVARRVLEQAAEVDPEIDQAYRIEIVP